MNIYLRKVASEGINHHVEHCIFVPASRVLFSSRCPTFRVSLLSSPTIRILDLSCANCLDVDPEVLQLPPRPRGPLAEEAVAENCRPASEKKAARRGWKGRTGGIWSTCETTHTFTMLGWMILQDQVNQGQLTQRSGSST